MMASVADLKPARSSRPAAAAAADPGSFVAFASAVCRSWSRRARATPTTSSSACEMRGARMQALTGMARAWERSCAHSRACDDAQTCRRRAWGPGAERPPPPWTPFLADVPCCAISAAHSLPATRQAKPRTCRPADRALSYMAATSDSAAPPRSSALSARSQTAPTQLQLRVARVYTALATAGGSFADSRYCPYCSHRLCVSGNSARARSYTHCGTGTGRAEQLGAAAVRASACSAQRCSVKDPTTQL